MYKLTKKHQKENKHKLDIIIYLGGSFNDRTDQESGYLADLRVTQKSCETTELKHDGGVVTDMRVGRNTVETQLVEIRRREKSKKIEI